MKTSPVVPATVETDADGVPFAATFGDRYHARSGALAQARHVFLGGNGLPGRWAGRARFVVLETGFGLGHNFLATWAAWRADPGCARLHYVAVDKHPPRRGDLVRVHASSLVGEATAAALAAQLQAAWPPLTGDLHRLVFDGGRVELLLAFGDATAWLKRLQLQADAVFLDGFAPERNPEMWSEALFAALPPLCAPQATAATWSVARAVRDGLAGAGFEVERADGFAEKREMTVARFAPRHRAAPPARRLAALPRVRQAIVVGAGLAGSAAAWALAEAGVHATVLESGPVVAAGASGNVAGLVRSLVSRDDGAHARWHRAAALEAQRCLAPRVSSGAVPGRLDGVLHLADDIHEMRERAALGGWPPEHVQALDAAAASGLAGLPGLGPAWFFPGGGWVAPGALVQALLAASGAAVRTSSRVATLQRRGAGWLACDKHGAPLAEAELVVLANADDAARLAPASAAAWRIGRTRGQVTQLPAQWLAQVHAVSPRLPLARNGYVIPMPDGSTLCGATQSLGDDEPRLRAADHEHNLGVWRRLTGQEPGMPSGVWPTDLVGRVAWRCHADDRLPLIGALPAAAMEEISAGSRATRLAQPRHVPREPGLFALTALGARGITSALLGARLLAAWVADAPLPVDTDLLDAVDAARHLSRDVARTASATRPRKPAASAHPGDQ
ncbi:MAG: FAD-dependent 5-carboxymethylaminomethyl-2-thiouridine(34) oxidoreductase MnmC [Rubrivivax sp.]|nr:FAD-dependent 5-carboxymethylaminomethyl-2-thiouridine(34) oxidoreductase MnmC [Rubrivivax sp.]